jgi:hypothetical protein
MSDAPSRLTSRRGRTLKLYLTDGTPSGVITAELGVSSVRAAVASRTALPELIRREEAIRTGIYLLVGPDPDLPGRQLVYVGEGDQVKTRLAAHDADETKEFFTRAVLIVRPHDPADADYLHQVTLTRSFRIAGERQMTGSAGQRRIPSEFIEDFPILIMGDNARRTAGRLLAEADVELSTMERTLADLRVQKRVLMQNLLTGQWRLDERFDPPALAPRVALVGGAA